MGLCPRLGWGVGGGGRLITGCYVLFIFRWAYNWAVLGKGTYKCGAGGEYKQNDSSVYNN